MNHNLGQLLIVGISGESLTTNEKKFIVENNISGVTLFGRNLSQPEQIRDLCQEIQSLRHQMPDKAPLYIAIDMEGGRVARLKSPFTQWPSAKKLGNLDSLQASFHFAEFMGIELKAVGINVNWAPCLDVLTNPVNTVIGDRAIGDNSELVARHSSSLIQGYLKAGISPCAKHFPGHGNTFLDSHENLPVEDLTKDRLDKRELVPFKQAIQSKIEMIMTSHILFRNIDPEWPCTLSEIFLKKILRDELNYQGLIVTDDLGMKALSKEHTVKEISVRAVQAGVDLLLYCNEPSSPPLALEALQDALYAQNKELCLSIKQVEKTHQRILEHKRKYLTHPDPLPIETTINLIGFKEHLELSHFINK